MANDVIAEARARIHLDKKDFEKQILVTLKEMQSLSDKGTIKIGAEVDTSSFQEMRKGILKQIDEIKSASRKGLEDAFACHPDPGTAGSR